MVGSTYSAVAWTRGRDLLILTIADTTESTANDLFYLQHRRNLRYHPQVLVLGLHYQAAVETDSSETRLPTGRFVIFPWSGVPEDEIFLWGDRSPVRLTKMQAAALSLSSCRHRLTPTVTVVTIDN